MAVDVILGLQWGDEGKGKIVDYLCDNYDIVARFQGGPNAGHTIIINDQKFVLHTIPSGVFRDHIINVIGNGVVIDPITLKKEIAGLNDLGVDVIKNLLVSRKAHLILPTHRYLDAASEAAKGKDKIGSTLRGIGPTYMDKTGRNGIRVGDLEENFEQKYQSLKSKHLELLKLYPPIDFDLEKEEASWFESINTLKTLQKVDGEYYLSEALSQGKKVLAEGAQGSMLDIDYGTYPFVTSSNTITSGVCNGLGIAPQKIGEVIGITKAYCTRVGSGPFPTELLGDKGEKLRKIGKEFGATTGRPRRCGWIDIPQLIYTIMLNGVTQLVVTKLDIMNEFETLEVGEKYKVNGTESTQVPFDLNTDLQAVYNSVDGWNCDVADAKNYQELPQNLRNYMDYLMAQLKTPVSYISVGPERSELHKVT